MDTKKLDKWAEKLLDTGKRNNMINFKDAKALTAEVLFPIANELFEKLDGITSLEVFDPKIAEDDDAEYTTALEATEQTDALGGKSAYMDRYKGLLRRSNQILLYNPAGSPLVAVRNIDKKAREFTEETGVNVAYMAFGFVHWKESDSSDVVFRAPVLLIPILLEQAFATEPYHIKSTGDDIIVNPTFSYKMSAEFGIKLPDYNDESLAEYLEKVKHLVKRLNWTVTEECKIGIFSFQKNQYVPRFERQRGCDSCKSEYSPALGRKL